MSAIPIPTPQKLRQLVGSEATREFILKNLRTALKNAKLKASAAKRDVSRLHERFKVVGAVFTRDEYVDIGEEFETLIVKQMKADEELKAANERVSVEKGLKKQDQLAILEEVAALRQAPAVAVANVSDAAILWIKHVVVARLVMAPGSDPDEVEAVRDFCRSKNWNAMGDVQ
ncbi:hypothetical protein RHGRI_032188 [Rhododendron griersonianum]|uniref:Uncharacterized protein n=1 Tax=Rhododendron griersonianum TaxID=479676 RepID=A0AAV6IBD6_9ERIC|nr:hypothetical protein RHGRI_032188 [Rhododendron griersonianum]